jgi:hypothetical protein
MGASTTGAAAHIHLDPATFNPSRIQPVTHDLASHPLLQVDALRALVRRLPAHKVRFHAITATASTDFERAPEEHHHHLGFEEALANIETSGSWIALHNVESDPAYKALLDEVLDLANRTIEAKDPGMFNRALWIFLQSPRSVTPFHMDHENNFLLQVQGRKHARLWHPKDCLTDYALEVFHAEFHRGEVKYQEAYDERSQLFVLEPGAGAYMPSTAPHLVTNLDNVSVTVSMTYCTAATRRIETVNRANHLLRRLGRSPRPVGASPVGDFVKYRLFQAYYDGRSIARGQSRSIPEWARH